MEKKECLYVYNWVTLLYSRDWHSIVNQLYINLKKKLKDKKKNPKKQYVVVMDLIFSPEFKYSGPNLQYLQCDFLWRHGFSEATKLKLDH